MMPGPREIIVFLFVLSLPLFSTGQGDLSTDTAEADTADGEPLIGLVLSGGGAKALAQIGALRVIDEAGIEIDYICGSSMGAIIGALYSIGYTPDEIEYYLANVDWNAIVTDETDRTGLSFFDKKSEERYLISFPFDGWHLKMPSALNYGQHIVKTLAYLTQKVQGLQNFSEFPIPFMCYATDIVRGEGVIIEKGYLADALRASSAFPTLYSPYSLNDTLLVDGGVINNFPVEPLKNKGMDIIIGVDVQVVRYDESGLTNIMRMLEQTTGIINAQNYDRQLAYTDVLIKPHIPGTGITTFEYFDSIVSAGETAARKQYSTLDSIGKLKSPRKHKGPGPPNECLLIREVTVSGNKHTTERYVLSRLGIDTGDFVRMDKIERGIDKLYGSKLFHTVDYRLESLDTGYAMVVRLREKENLSELRLGIHYDDDFKTGLLVNFTTRNLLLKNSRFLTDFVISQNPRITSMYTYDRGFIPTLGIKFRANRFRTHIYRERRPINSLVYRDLSTDIFVQSTLYDTYGVGGGIQFENINLREDISLLEPDQENKDFINYYAFLRFDSFDRSFFPQKGFKLNASFRLISERNRLDEFYEPSSVIFASYEQAISFSPTVGLHITATGATTLGPDVDYAYNIFLGSMGENYINYVLPFIGYQYMELIGRNVVLARGDAYWEFFRDQYLAVKVNIGKMEPTFNELWSNEELLDGWAVSYAYDSPLGPLEFNVSGSTNHSEIYTYLSLGYWF